MTPPRVCIVVLAWNRRADTLECLRSLARVAEPEIRVILVDNASSDGTVEAARQEFPRIELIETGENLGYTGGNNVGIRRALDLGAEYVLILNNDTVVAPESVRELLAVASRSERIGFVSPKIYFMDPPDRIWFAGARFCTWCGYGRMVGYREKDRARYDRVREIDRPCGCAMLVSRRLCGKPVCSTRGSSCMSTKWNGRFGRAGWGSGHTSHRGRKCGTRCPRPREGRGIRMQSITACGTPFTP